MTKAELAEKLHGNEYMDEINDRLEMAAKDAGLVVVFGASDDLMEFRGAIHDEIGCYEGASVFIVNGKLWNGPGCDHHGGDGCEHARAAEAKAKKQGAKIEAVWAEDDYSWTYKTDIPHATFDVMEDGEKYCRGIVFSLAETAAA